MEEKKTFNLKIAILIVIMLLIIVGTMVYVIVIMGGKNKAEVQNGGIQNNFYNDGYFEEPENLIYISNEYYVEEKPEEVRLTLNKEEYPKVDGATAMLPMSKEIAKAVIGLNDDEVDEFIVHTKTESAYQNLIDKKADLIFVSEPSDDILNKAKTAGVEFEMVGIGRDGFVFLVNENNKVNSLTLTEIRNIYAGVTTNWKEVGGDDETIIPYQRNKNSGSQNLMEKMVMQDIELMQAPKDFYLTSMDHLISYIAEFNNSKRAIGYSIYLYAKEQYVRNEVKFLSIDGVYPTDETIENGTYPLSKIVYAVYRKDEPENSHTRKLVEWLKTETGQKVVEAGGYVGCK